MALERLNLDLLGYECSKYFINIIMLFEMVMPEFIELYMIQD